MYGFLIIGNSIVNVDAVTRVLRTAPNTYTIMIGIETIPGLTKPQIQTLLNLLNLDL